MQYNPKIFKASTIDQAMGIILTPEGSMSTSDRWKKETPVTASYFEMLNLKPESVVLDFGCGIGRLSKGLIDKYGCTVVGIDIETTMRAFGAAYVNSGRFIASAREAVQALGLQFDAIISVYVLQHVLDPRDEINFLAHSLKSGGRFFVLNEVPRIVPTIEKGWQDDGKDIRAELDVHFRTVDHGEYRDFDKEIPRARPAYWWVGE